MVSNAFMCYNYTHTHTQTIYVYCTVIAYVIFFMWTKIIFVVYTLAHGLEWIGLDIKSEQIPSARALTRLPFSNVFAMSSIIRCWFFFVPSTHSNTNFKIYDVRTSKKEQEKKTHTHHIWYKTEFALGWQQHIKMTPNQS